jgi:hypothetical protein
VSVSKNEITIDKPLSYFHYGSGETITTTQGILDMRGVVAMVDRNIQIAGVMTKDQWGANVVVAGSRLFDSKT